MRQSLIISAILTTAGAVLVGAAFSLLPLGVILSTPLRVFVSFHAAPVERLSTNLADSQADALWADIDKFAVNNGFIIKRPIADGKPRIVSDYYSKSGFNIDVEVRANTAIVSFFSVPPKNPPLDSFVATFRHQLSNVQFSEVE